MQVDAHGTRIEIDDQGPVGGPALLLVMGLGMQLTAWPEPFVQLLVQRGFRVLRIDNRDAGLSQGFDALGVPNLALAGMRYALRLPVASPYTLAEMARDTLGVLDALGLARAHVVGASMGGMIAQHLAAAHPQRVASLGLLMTTSGARHLPQPSWKLQMAMLRRPAAGGGTEAVVEHLVRLMGLIGSPAFPMDPAQRREQLRALVQRAWRPAGTARQLAAIVADGDRTALVGRIVAPTLVLHGEADPLVPVAAAHELAARIPGARLHTFPGMGHDLPAPLWPALAAAIAEHAQAAGAAAR